MNECSDCSGLLLTVHTATQRYFVLTSSSIIVLRLTSPIDQLLHVPLLSSPYSKLLHSDSYSQTMIQFNNYYGVTEALTILISLLSLPTAQSIVSRIHFVLASVASLKTYRVAGDSWGGGVTGDVGVITDLTHSVIYEAIIK